jgi:hypothetical protein
MVKSLWGTKGKFPREHGETDSLWKTFTNHTSHVKSRFGQMNKPTPLNWIELERYTSNRKSNLKTSPSLFTHTSISQLCHKHAWSYLQTVYQWRQRSSYIHFSGPPQSIIWFLALHLVGLILECCFQGLYIKKRNQIIEMQETRSLKSTLSQPAHQITYIYTWTYGYSSTAGLCSSVG